MMNAFAQRQWVAANLDDNRYLVIDMSVVGSKTYIRNSFSLDTPTADLTYFSALTNLKLTYGILRSYNIIFCDEDGFSAQLAWLLFVIHGYSVAYLSVLLGGKGYWECGVAEPPRVIKGVAAQGARRPLYRRMFVSAREILLFIQQQRAEYSLTRYKISDSLLSSEVELHANFYFVVDTRDSDAFEITGAIRISRHEFANVRTSGIDVALFAARGVNLETGCVFVGDSLLEIAPVLFAAYLCCGDVGRLYFMPENASSAFDGVFGPAVLRTCE